MTESNPVPVFEPSGINQPFAIEGDPLDQPERMVPDSESAYEAVEYESA